MTGWNVTVVVLAAVLSVAVVAIGIGMVRLLRTQSVQRERAADEVRRTVEADLAQARSAAAGAAAEVRAEADAYREQARAQAATVLQESERLRRDGEAAVSKQRDELREQRTALDRREARLSEREDRIDAEQRVMEARQSVAEEIRKDLRFRAKELARAEQHQRDELARIAGMTPVEAKQVLLSSVEHEARLQAAAITRDIENDARRTGEQRARQILVTAMQRLVAEQTSESVVSTVALPGDEMKGRIIGREGRNIRAFEQVTGVNVLIDDTPESVLLSCFDPVRREVARLTLTELVADGRIHPARIEEVFERCSAQLAEQSLRAAEDAVAEMRITDLHPDLLPVLGSLRFRTSYGQNVLTHLVECGHLAAMMAAELGVDADVCRRAAFLHDIGKAVSHETDGSHAQLGADLARRHGEHPDVVHAIEAHHNEIEPQTVEAILTQVADAVSGSRPGARRESLEAYVTRLEKLEEIAQAHPGVERVFAMHAGRDVRVMVAPSQVDDAGAQAIARDIARQISEELTYPGQIRITVVRESRAISIAH
ncbi:ribonuclease Y [Propionicicella superfundia]|uniref:ribonuclease Y n=1 Tax=Propionicicella superfundia TaxID=348582 RepID=UPI000422C5F6|nr:ribonuclease Y [Propionicicella superfundia]